MPRVAVFGPNPLLSVTIEARGGGDDVHVHAGGQGVWLSRMAAELGADVVLCGFVGGETGDVLEGLLGRAWSSSYVFRGVSDRAGFDAALARLFAEHARDGRVIFRYRAVAFAFSPRRG